MERKTNRTKHTRQKLTKMIENINNKIKALKDELKAIDYTNGVDCISLGKIDKMKRRDIISKIQVLNEVIISYGIKN